MEKKICIACEKEINIKKEGWYKTIFFIGEKIDSEIFFHRQCYKDFHKKKFKEEYEKKMKMVSPFLGKLVKNIRVGIEN